MEYIKLNNTYFCEPKSDLRDRIQVEIGDSKQSEFYPQVKLMRWDNEVNLSVRLSHNEISPSVSADNNSINWIGKTIESKFYELPINEEFPEGGYEFEITALEKLSSNVVEFSIQTKGLNFYYQPPLNQEMQNGWYAPYRKEIVVTETEVKDANTGEIIDYRPENVVGSYAVYHATKGVLNDLAGKDYKSGKAFHIYRPRIIDAAGNSVWGELHINLENEILSVVIPQEFLDKATYPIRHMAGLTFGYGADGVSTTSGVADAIIFCRKAYSPASNGTGNHMKMRGAQFTAPNNWQMAVYTNTSGDTFGLVTNAYTVSVNINGAIKWWQANFSSAPSFTPITSYYLLHNRDGTGAYICYDTGTTRWWYAAQTFNTWSASFVASNSGQDREYSIYVDYTEAGGGSILPLVAFGTLGGNANPMMG